MRIPYISLIAAGALTLGGCAYGDLGYGVGYGGYGGYGYGGYGYDYASPYYGAYGAPYCRLVRQLLLSGHGLLRVRQLSSAARLEQSPALLLDVAADVRDDEVLELERFQSALHDFRNHIRQATSPARLISCPTDAA